MNNTKYKPKIGDLVHHYDEYEQSLNVRWIGIILQNKNKINDTWVVHWIAVQNGYAVETSPRSECLRPI